MTSKSRLAACHLYGHRNISSAESGGDVAAADAAEFVTAASVVRLRSSFGWRL